MRFPLVRLYLKGWYHYQKFTLEDYEKSREYFEQAIERDPSFALAYAGLSYYYFSVAIDGYMPPREVMPKSESAARKALDLDETLSEAHDALAGVMWIQWNWTASEQESRRALALNPNFAFGRVAYSQNLRALGRFEEALQETKRAEEVDPLSILTNKSLAATYYWSRQYDRAIKQYRRTLELDPNLPEAHDSLADIYKRKGMFVEAIEEMQRYLVLLKDEEGAAALGDDFEKNGYQAAMQSLYRKTLEELKKSSEEGNYVSPMNFAYVYTSLGDKDQALAWLERAYDERSPWLANLKTDPLFDDLRSDPRFKDLIRRVGLPL